MHFLLAAVAIGVAFSSSSRIERRVGPNDLVLVQSVIDGHTIVVSNVGRVRLLGIAAPEVRRGLDGGAPLGREARDRLAGLLLNRWVRLETDASAGEASSRRAAYVVTGDGTLVNAVMVREGLARVSTRRPIARLAELRRAEAEAQAFRRGMWGSAPRIPAAGYTRGSKASRPPTSRATPPSHPRRSTHTTKP